VDNPQVASQDLELLVNIGQQTLAQVGLPPRAFRRL
jgi:hypothetical protein